MASILWDKIDNIYAVQRLAGEIDRPMVQLTDITRTWEDGSAYVAMGRRGLPTALLFSCLATNSSQADNLGKVAKRLVGRVVSIRLQEIVYQDYLVLGASVLGRTPVMTTVGGVLYNGTNIGVRASTWKVDLEFGVQYAGTNFEQ